MIFSGAETDQKKEQDLIKGMDLLLEIECKPSSICQFWANSISSSVIECYKRGEIIDV